MNYQFSSSANCESFITPEELNQIIEAITDGRYSWACVLILRFIGYNPLHYIPQRTYSRLIKENSQVVQTSASTNQNNLKSTTSHHHLHSSPAYITN
ncbi:MAG: heterocyst formation protein HetP [Nostocales cyanobacterium]|nr:MAG: heterocyst formation protein HetP [Nostocales cyanobacterium]